ncbi:hypothetical protein [Reichenbachiella sp.]|uniref:hypothetical protein n=1 Tax=Reichenbachiella sp. TaxID=2184521 RepID=UPI003B5AAA4B
MKIVNIKSHDFKKVNLVTLKKGGDNYECSVCGCKGYRSPFQDNLTLTEKEFKKSLKCSFQQPISKRPKKVLIVDLKPELNLPEGTYDVVDCPAHQDKKFKHDVWVFNDARGEPCRILPHEIISKFF